jgi:hypothetical protein
MTVVRSRLNRGTTTEICTSGILITDRKRRSRTGWTSSQLRRTGERLLDPVSSSRSEGSSMAGELKQRGQQAVRSVRPAPSAYPRAAEDQVPMHELESRRPASRDSAKNGFAKLLRERRAAHCPSPAMLAATARSRELEAMPEKDPNLFGPGRWALLRAPPDGELSRTRMLPICLGGMLGVLQAGRPANACHVYACGWEC